MLRALQSCVHQASTLPLSSCSHNNIQGASRHTGPDGPSSSLGSTVCMTSSAQKLVYYPLNPLTCSGIVMSSISFHTAPARPPGVLVARAGGRAFNPCFTRANWEVAIDSSRGCASAIASTSTLHSASRRAKLPSLLCNSAGAEDQGKVQAKKLDSFMRALLWSDPLDKSTVLGQRTT